MDNMTGSRPKRPQHQLVLALALFLLGQLALALHSHDLSLHSADTEKCVICLVATSDDPATISEIANSHLSVASIQPMPALGVQLAQQRQTLAQPRAPPFF